MEGGLQNKGDKVQQEECRHDIEEEVELGYKEGGEGEEERMKEKKMKEKEEEMESFADGSTCHSIPSGALRADKPDS